MQQSGENLIIECVIATPPGCEAPDGTEVLMMKLMTVLLCYGQRRLSEGLGQRDQ